MIVLSLLTQGVQWVSLAIDGARATVAFLVVNIVVLAVSVALLRLTRRGRVVSPRWS